MSDFNLPLGCRSSDIPGNRPSDLAYGHWLEKVLDLDPSLTIDDPGLYDCYQQGLSPEETAEKQD